jgi:hypothetical protein
MTALSGVGVAAALGAVCAAAPGASSSVPANATAVIRETIACFIVFSPVFS